MKPIRSILSVACCMLLAAACAPGSDPDEMPSMGPGDDAASVDDELAEGDESENDAIESVDEADLELSADGSSLAACNQCNNCVYYARCRQPALPGNLTTFQNKMDIVNSQTAKVGNVAIIKTGSIYGHVAYVTKVDGAQITIAEGNWPSGQCGTRKGTKAQLNIKGYFKP